MQRETRWLVHIVRLKGPGAGQVAAHSGGTLRNGFKPRPQRSVTARMIAIPQAVTSTAIVIKPRALCHRALCRIEPSLEDRKSVV